MRPGFLMNRDGDFRWVEWFMNKINIGSRI